MQKLRFSNFSLEKDSENINNLLGWIIYFTLSEVGLGLPSKPFYLFARPSTYYLLAVIPGPCASCIISGESSRTVRNGNKRVEEI